MASFFNRQLTRTLRPFFESNSANIWSSTGTTKATPLTRCTRNYWPGPTESPQPIQQSRIGSGRSSGATISCDVHRGVDHGQLRKLTSSLPWHLRRSLFTPCVRWPLPSNFHRRQCGGIYMRRAMFCDICDLSPTHYQSLKKPHESGWQLS
jgi:hypothetical protein